MRFNHVAQGDTVLLYLESHIMYEDKDLNSKTMYSIL